MNRFFPPCVPLEISLSKIGFSCKTLQCNHTNWVQTTHICGIYKFFLKKVWNDDADDELSTVIIIVVVVYSFSESFTTDCQTQKRNDEITFTSFTGIMFVKIANKTILLFQRILKVFFLVFCSRFCFCDWIHFSFYVFECRFNARLIKIKLAIFGFCFSFLHVVSFESTLI